MSRVLVVDDHKLCREGLQAKIDAEPGMAVVAEACDGQEAVTQALEQETFPGLSRRNCRPRFAPFHHHPPQSQIEAALQFVSLAVACQAMRLEDRPHIRLKSRCSPILFAA